MKRLALNGIGLLFIVVVFCASPFDSSAYSIVSSRPRLYFTSADLSVLRERIMTTHKTQWQALVSWKQPDANAYKTYSGRDIDRTHEYIERNAFIYLMLANSNPALAEQHAQVAKNWMMELAAYDFTTAPNDAFEFLWALTIGYDWLYGWAGFSEAEKQQVRNQLVERTDIHVNKTGLAGFSSFPKGPATSKSIYDNMSTENNMANAFVGLALWEPDNRYGTNTSAKRYMDAAYYRFQEVYKATNTYCSNGGYWEGQGYYGARLQGEVYYAYVWKVATGEDLFAANDHLRNSVYYWIYGLRPDGVSSREGDQTCLPTGCDRNRFIAEILANYYQDGYFQWYAQFKGAFKGGDWPDIVLYNAHLPAKDPSTLPLYRHFDFGHIVIRTGWNIGPDSQDTYFTFSIHDWVSGHTHLDANSFTLFRKGALAIDSGRYRGNSATAHAHERNYAIRTIAHNTITVYKPGEDFGSFSNDGGQEFLFKESKAADPIYISDLFDGTRFDTSTLNVFDVGAGYYYIKGNATDAYHSTGYNARSDGAEAKISNFTREAAFFTKSPFPILVVFDRISSLNAAWKKKWLLHSIHEPMVGGEVTRVEVPNHIVNYNGNLVTIVRNGGKLWSKTMLPPAVNIRKVGGSGYEFWVDDPGKNYPLGSDAASDIEAGAWRVEIEPVLPAKDDTFLHILYPADVSVASIPRAYLMDAEGMYGSQIGDQVVLFSKTGNPVSQVNYSVVGLSEKVAHLITDLIPGIYQVTKDGWPIPGSPFTTSLQNTLLFESSGGGNFLVRNSSQPNRPPVANAGPDQTVTLGNPVSFNGSGSSDPDGDSLTYLWNFGDGATGSGVIVPHTYASVGTYTVTLTVSDGKLSSTDTSVIRVNPPGGGGSFFDSFDRPDSTDLGNGWLEVRGNLMISGQRLTNTAIKGDHIGVVPQLAGATQSAGADFASVDNNLAPRFGVILRYQDPLNYYLVYRQSGGSSQLRISKVVNAKETILKTASISNPPKNTFFRIEGRANGPTLTLWLDGVARLSVSDATFPAGTVGILIGSNNIKLHPADNFSAVVQ